MRIENWSVVNVLPSEYSAPETGQPSLYGQVFGHPEFLDGTFVTTSRITGKNHVDEILTRSGSVYSLGKVNPMYEEKYPDAKNRLLNNLCKNDKFGPVV